MRRLLWLLWCRAPGGCAWQHWPTDGAGAPRGRAQQPRGRRLGGLLLLPPLLLLLLCRLRLLRRRWLLIIAAADQVNFVRLLWFGPMLTLCIAITQIHDVTAGNRGCCGGGWSRALRWRWHCSRAARLAVHQLLPVASVVSSALQPGRGLQQALSRLSVCGGGPRAVAALLFADPATVFTRPHGTEREAVNHHLFTVAYETGRALKAPMCRQRCQRAG